MDKDNTVQLPNYVSHTCMLKELSHITCGTGDAHFPERMSSHPLGSS